MSSTDKQSEPSGQSAAPTQASGFSPWNTEPEAVVSRLASDSRDGLTKQEAAERLGQFGPNRLEAGKTVSRWRKVMEQFADPLVLLLLVAIAISLLAWFLEGRDGTPFEAIVIAIIVVANAIVGLWQEAKAEAAVAALAKMVAPHANVVRGGDTVRVETAEVVPGDILLLTEGDAVCADGRLLEAATLKVGEAALTGESGAALKQIDSVVGPAVVGDQLSMVFSGTAVTSGRGKAVVTSTGMDTEIGRIAAMLGQAKEPPTPLQKEIGLVGRILGILVVVIAVVVVGAILLTSDVDTGSDLVEVLLVGVSLAVAAVPEGLPAILAIVLALGVQKMAAKEAIVKKLSSVETLGSASVICSDKTGTLTSNEMTIEQLAVPSGQLEITGSGYRPEGELIWKGAALTDGPIWTEAQLLVNAGSLANDAATEEVDGTWLVKGDPTEGAFLVAEAKLGVADLRKNRFSRIDEVPFTSERKLMSTIDSDAENESHPVLVTKGAPDVLLDLCSSEWVDGNRVELTSLRRQEITDAIDGLADQALRTLAVAFRWIGNEDSSRGEALEHDLIYLGTAGIIDPPRIEARQAIAEAQAAGIRIIMITGDHPRTAGRIAEQLGIVKHPAAVVTGLEIEALSDEVFRQAVRETSVFARVAPEHKLRIVKALQNDANIVAMTGDGVNDAPALKYADIGIAMGITGTEVSKEAANMILADDNFATIITAVREGRGIFESIQKFLRYLLSSNMGEVLVMFLGVVGAGLLGLDETGEVIAVPLLATHILWINLLTDTAPALALGVDSPVGDVMDRPPRSLSDRVIDTEMQLSVLLTGLVMATATLVSLDLTLAGGFFESNGEIVEARTVAFTTLVLAQLFNCFNSRSARRSAFVDPFGNRLLWAAVSLSFLLQVLVVHVPFLNRAFETTGLSLGQWMLCAALGSSVLVVDEFKKIVLRLIGS